MIAALRRALDRWKHPGEFRQQREYRRWREILNRHNPAPPYQLTSARLVDQRHDRIPAGAYDLGEITLVALPPPTDRDE